MTIRWAGTGMIAPGPFLAELGPLLDDALWLLSLLSHKRLAWYAAELTFVPDEPGGGVVRTTTIQRRQWVGHEGTDHADAYVISPAALRDGLFPRLLERYASSPVKDELRRAITYLLTSYEEGYLEARLSGLYAALESLVASLGDDALLGSSRFRRLTDKLEGAIRAEVAEPEIAAGIVAKLPELRRRAFVERLLALLAAAHVPLARLWPPDADAAEEVRQLVRRRNAFIHQGRLLEEDDRYLADFGRLQCLVEVWLLKLLDCPDEALTLDHTGPRLRVIRMPEP